MAGPLSASARSSRVAALALLLLIALAFYLPGFTALPPVDRDESHFAEASKQMLESGNFIDIRMQEEARYNKPIGIYWLQSAAVSLLGRPLNEIWPYRLPSLVGALVGLVFVARLGGRLFDRRIGLIAALLLAASLLLGIEARLAKTDAALFATSMAAFDGLIAAYLGRAKRRDALQFWIGLSFGILIKGPVLPFFLLTTAGTVSLVQRRWRWLDALEPRLGLPLLVLIVAPWLVAIGIASHGAFFSQSLGHDLGAKLVGGEESHGFPPGFYLVAMGVTFWPGGLLFAAALPSLWRQRRETAIRFLLAWPIPARFGPEPVAILEHPSGLEVNLVLNAPSATEPNILMDVAEKHPGITHFALLCPDIMAAKARLEAAGIPLSGGPIRFSPGTQAIFVRDPDRNVIELHQRD